MKTTKKILMVAVSLCILLSMVCFTAYATILNYSPVEIKEIESNTGELLPYASRSCGSGDVFSKVTWNSLEEAKGYYGRNWEYKSCYIVHNGKLYNYYYQMTDGKVYISVAV